MAKANNVLIAQSGGATSVVNNSLRGVIETCRMFPDVFGKIYAGWHGIEGVLKEELLDLSVEDEEEISLLRTTPAAGVIGTCRYKLKPSMKDDLARILDVFRAHQIRYFFYDGGNDSMDTADKVARMVKSVGLDLITVGIPMTIGNDIGDSEFKLIDHSPGYGSVARYWMTVVQNANQENEGSYTVDPVLVLQTMGRRIGYIQAAARLADRTRRMPLLIFMTESGLGLNDLCDAVNDTISRNGRCIVVVSEGFNVGDVGAVRDAFGHVQYGAGKTTVGQVVINHLNQNGLLAKGTARANIAGTDQRDCIGFASTVDLDEAYRVAQQAVLIAKDDGHGYMSTILREPGMIYNVRYDKVPLEKIANSERFFPKEWISESRTDVTDEYVRYARPLVGEDVVSAPIIDGVYRFARFKKVFAEKKLDPYVLQADRICSVPAEVEV